MRTRFVMFCLLGLCLSVAGEEEAHATGVILATPEELAALPKAGLECAGADSLPASVDLMSECPPPGNQGSKQGSCVAWSLAYSLKSYQENQEMHWGTTSPRTQFSPAFIYNQLNGGKNNGLSVGTALKFLKNAGCATLADFPYNQNDYRTQPTQEIKERAKSFRIESFSTVPHKNILQVKQLLAGHLPVIIAAGVTNEFHNGRFDRIYKNHNKAAENGAHAMCVIGYDNKINAFKIINSWGTNWGQSGYAWIDYTAFTEMVSEAYTAKDAKNTDVAVADFVKGQKYRIRIARWNWEADDFRGDCNITVRVFQGDRVICSPFWPLDGAPGDHVVMSNISWVCEYDGASKYQIEFEEHAPSPLPGGMDWALGLRDFGRSVSDGTDVKPLVKGLKTEAESWPWNKRLKVGSKSYIETVAELIEDGKSSTGQIEAADTPDTWATSTKQAIATWLQGMNAINCAARIQKITHPTGESGGMGKFTIEKSAGAQAVEVTITVNWKGGFTGTEYATTIKWTVSENGSACDILKDNALVSVAEENRKELAKYFESEVYPAVKKLIKKK